jgi:hypothetical protein
VGLRWAKMGYSGLDGARKGKAGLGGARRSLKFTNIHKKISVFAENFSVFARRC